jgi:outer membrane receptor protein involved in Fe transport
VYATADIADGWGTALSGSAYGQGGYLRSGAQGNELLKPERKTEYELGLDLRFVQNRIGFSATYYSNNTRDAIFALPTAPTTGYTTRSSNTASLMNRGIELSLDADIIKTKDFGFNLSPNFSLNRNRVLSLGGAQYYGFTGFTGSESVVIPGYQ